MDRATIRKWKKQRPTIEEIEEECEKQRAQCIRDGIDFTWEMRCLNNYLTNRLKEEYEKEHPEPTEPRHREHGWYLPNDD